MRGIFTKGLLAALCLGIAAPSANAYTIDEIIEASPYMILSAKYSKNCTGITNNYTLSECVTLEKVDDTHIMIKGMTDDELDFLFDLTDSNGVETTDGTRFQAPRGRYANNTREWGISNTSYSRRATIFNIEKTGDSFTLRALDEVAFLIVQGTQGSATVFTSFNNMFMTSFVPNAWASDSFRKYDADGWNETYYGATPTAVHETSRVDRLYPVKVTINGNNFSILNLGNNGYAIDQSKLSEIKGTLINNKLTFNKSQWALSKLYYDIEKIGYYNLPVSGFEYRILGLPMEDDTTVDIASLTNESINDNLFGSYTAEGVAHNSAEASWVTNGGSRRTYEGFTLDIDPYTYYYRLSDHPVTGDEYGNYYWHLKMEDGYHNTRIQADNDVTADVELALTGYSADNTEGLKLEGMVTVNKHWDYIDHCEVFVVKGKYDHITNEGFIHDLETGHTDAVLYHCPVEGTEHQAMKAPAEGKGYEFKKAVTASALGFTPELGDYTAFVKTVYTPESGLAPTFHSMQNFEIDIINSIAVPDVTDNSFMTAKGGNASLEIECNGEVKVYNASGVNVYTGVARHLKLTPGLYIVTDGHHTIKVSVR